MVAKRHHHRITHIHALLIPSVKNNIILRRCRYAVIIIISSEQVITRPRCSFNHIYHRM